MRSLARCMSQLHTLKFDKLSGLKFEPNGGLSCVGDGVYMDVDIRKVLEGEETWGTAVLAGPVHTTQEHILENLEDLRIPSDAAEHMKADLEIIRLAVASMPSVLETNGESVLGHPDFNYQNIFVDHEGELHDL